MSILKSLSFYLEIWIRNVVFFLFYDDIGDFYDKSLTKNFSPLFKMCIIWIFIKKNTHTYTHKTSFITSLDHRRLYFLVATRICISLAPLVMHFSDSPPSKSDSTSSESSLLSPCTLDFGAQHGPRFIRAKIVLFFVWSTKKKKQGLWKKTRIQQGKSTNPRSGNSTRALLDFH